MAKKNISKAADVAPVIDAETKIDLTKVKGDVVDEYLKKLGLDESGSISERTRRLAGHFTRKLDAKKVNGKLCGSDSICNPGCGGRSDSRLAKCPFCGDASADGTAVAPADEKAALVELGEKKDGQPLVQVSRKRRRVEGGQETLPMDQPESKAAEAHEEGHAEVVDAGTAEIVKSDEPAITASEDTTATVNDLDQSVAKIHALVGSNYETQWDLGGVLADNYKRKLYLQRRLDGVPVYSGGGWAEFVKREIPVSVRYSYDLIDIATNYSRNDFREYGIKKLLAGLRLDADDRTKLLEETKGLSIQEVKNRVTELVGDTKRDTGREALVLGSTTDVGKAISDERWSDAGELLRFAAAAAKEEGHEDVGFDTSKARESIAVRLGIDDRTLRKYVATLDEKGVKLRTVPASKGGAPKREPAKKAPKPEPKKAVKEPKHEPAKKTPAAAPLVTVPIQLGRVRIPLLARPMKKNAPEKKARRLADDPWAIETLPNGVVVRYAIIAGQHGFLNLVIDRTRVNA